MALTLRNYPDDDALHHPEKYSKALSFSPDIIPLYGTKADKDLLTHPTSWRGFTGMPIVGGHDNNVYLRGHGSSGPHVASLKVVPSELILWPHVWHNANAVASGPTVIHAGESEGPCASDSPLHFRPPHCTGNTYSLVAHVAKHVPGEEVKPPSFDLEHFSVDDFVSFLKQDKEHTFYNVIVADPTLNRFSTTTRLRMIGKSPVPISFRLNWHSGPQIPDGLQVSLVDDHGIVTVSRTDISSFGERKFSLDPSYDGNLMLSIFAPAGKAFFEPYSCLSLQVFTNTTSLAGFWSSPQLLGALNIIFEPNATRHLRFASHTVTQQRESDDPSKLVTAENRERGEHNKQDCGAIPVTQPAATGWWTRTLLSDGNNFPRHEQIGGSPDIQPVGTDPREKDFGAILRNPQQDYSTANNVDTIFGNRDNYVYVRGHSTLTNIDVQCRIFAVHTSHSITPSTYLKSSVRGTVGGGRSEINELRISHQSADQFYVFDKPFVISHPSDPTQFPDEHYCLVAEYRQKRDCCPVYPGWPSDNWANYATVTDFQAYCLGSPVIAYRNVTWKACQPGGDKCWSWSCSTTLDIPDTAYDCSFWTVLVECTNSVILPGCKWSLACDDKEIFPDGVCFKDEPISTRSPAYAGCHFTGARAGYRAKITLTLTWCDDGDRHKCPPPCVNFRLAMTESVTAHTKHLTFPAPEGCDQWPFYVTKRYPYIGNKAHPSPLPTFASAGANKWPYKSGDPQFNLGQVTITAKPQ